MNPSRPKFSLGNILGGRPQAEPAAAATVAGAAKPPLGMRLKQYPCFDFQMYVDPGDVIASPIVHHGVYEHHVVPLFRETVRPGMNVLDIGANMGVYSVAAALSGGHVTAIDASAENCKLVTLNAQLNNVVVKALPVAVSDEYGMGLFGRVDQTNKAINRFATLSRETFDGFEATFSAPIDALIGNERVDVVKIDIDGREYAALRNANQLFAQRPIFFMEYARDLTMPGSGASSLDLLRLFTDRGYSISTIGLAEPSVEAGADIELVDRLAREAFEKHTHVCIDLLLRP